MGHRKDHTVIKVKVPPFFKKLHEINWKWQKSTKHEILVLNSLQKKKLITNKQKQRKKAFH